MGTNYYLVKNRPSISSPLHIGKSSAGWRFLFHKPSIWETDKPLNTFEQWRDYLKESTESKEFVIMNEYDDLVTFDYLMELIEEKQRAVALSSINEIGFIERGTGQHQSNTVYGTNGICPCQYAGQYKEPFKVVENEHTRSK